MVALPFYRYVYPCMFHLTKLLRDTCRTLVLPPMSPSSPSTFVFSGDHVKEVIGSTEVTLGKATVTLFEELSNGQGKSLCCLL